MLVRKTFPRSTNSILFSRSHITSLQLSCFVFYDAHPFSSKQSRNVTFAQTCIFFAKRQCVFTEKACSPARAASSSHFLLKYTQKGTRRWGKRGEHMDLARRDLNQETNANSGLRFGSSFDYSRCWFIQHRAVSLSCKLLQFHIVSERLIIFHMYLYGLNTFDEFKMSSWAHSGGPPPACCTAASPAAIARRASRPSRKRRLRRRNHELNHSEISGNYIHKV